MTWNMTTPFSLTDEVLGAALIASLLAGEEILEVYDSDFEVRYKSDSSPLTQADRRSHEVVIRHLVNAAPGASPVGVPILSEEGRDIAYEDRRSWDYFWLIDPLDGTKEFVKRNGEFTVNVALVRGNRPVLGVVYLPAKRELYLAAAGHGAYYLDSRLLSTVAQMADSGPATVIQSVLHQARRLNPRTPGQELSKLRTVHSRSHSSPEEEIFLSKMRESFGQVEELSAGSSLKFCLLAQDRCDIYPRFGPTMEWDTAAGQCIVEQAGGQVMEVDSGDELRYNKTTLRNGSFIALGQRFERRSAERDTVLHALRH
jgi:3'(2'), 5'-bisphosphate nucleotidase